MGAVGVEAAHEVAEVGVEGAHGVVARLGVGDVGEPLLGKAEVVEDEVEVVGPGMGGRGGHGGSGWVRDA